MQKIFHDIETFKNFFCVCVEDFSSNETKTFEISTRKNQLIELIEFYKNINVVIGYNSLDFDDILMTYIIKSKQTDLKKIWDFAQTIIKEEVLWKNQTIKKYISPVWKHQIDLMRMLFSKGLRVKLKSLNISTRFHNIEETPVEWIKELTFDEMDLVISYCKTDVLSTKHLLLHKDLLGKQPVLDKLIFRNELFKQTGINNINSDDVKLGVEILKHKYAQKTGLEFFEFNRRTPRDKIVVKDIISPLIKFETPEFINLLDNFNNLVITKTKGAFKEKVEYKGIKLTYEQGGLHSEDEAALFVKEDGFIFDDQDVASLYPSLMINLNIYPEHLGVEFIQLYKQIVDERLAAKKARDMLTSDIYKLSANGSYGKLNEEYSWLYDPLAAMKVTINGQLFISMLIERIELIDGCEIISVNTDGVTTKVQNFAIEEYQKTLQQWEIETRLILETTRYSKIFRRDVNNYVAIYENGKVKKKGIFLTEPILGKGYDMPIVAKALEQFIVNNIPVEKTIFNHQDILDFCIGTSVGKNSTKGEYKVFWNNQIQQNTLRFYASDNGHYLYKQRVGNETFEHLLKDSLITVYNKHVEKLIQEYQINYDFYIKKANDVVNEVLGIGKEKLKNLNDFAESNKKRVLKSIICVEPVMACSIYRTEKHINENQILQICTICNKSFIINN